MKQILSDFVNLIYPKENGEEWNWGEILAVIGGIGVVAVIYFLFS